MECIEKAYEELPVQRAAELLFCHPSELEALVVVVKL